MTGLLKRLDLLKSEVKCVASFIEIGYDTCDKIHANKTAVSPRVLQVPVTCVT